MKNKNLLITGGAGFIGSHLVHLLVQKYQGTQIINLDSLTYAADLTRLEEIEGLENYTFIAGDIRDAALVDEIFQKYKIDGVMHLAAESHVDNSISNPSIFVETNVIGTHNLLSSAKKLWKNSNGQLEDQYKNAKFLHVSTDEVYGTLGETGYFTEETPYAPNSPYSASKASSDMIARSYYHTFDMPIIISNCSNNYGPMQHDEKLIPTVIRKALEQKEIPVYGNGKNIRDWLYVRDHCIALELVFLNGKLGDSYNIGTNNEKTNIDLVNEICDILDELKPKASGSYSSQISFVQDRAGHDFRYAIDHTKISKELGWQPEHAFREDLKNTVEWYIESYSNK
ncbi:MAG: dTDP-glucose 4,6-dehydratase [Rickettsiaceae bacterium]|nr:dTDP-glucose 4,6-dehydratase [Rickettsiaceae bacterium]